MSSIYIGTSGWYYKAWAGTFYPEGLRQSDWLPFFVRHFPTVEINATFYRLPFENMVTGWHRKAPEGFVYAVKGSRRITHLKKLVDVDDEIERFFERISPLGEHLGPILWQLPPHLHKDVKRLDAFLARLPGRFRHTVEFRHPSWVDGETCEVLAAHRAANVAISSMRMPMDLTTTTDFVYIRFHGIEGGYSHDYTASELAPWVEHIQRSASEGRTVYAYFNNDGNTRAPKNAKELTGMVQG